MLNIKILGIGCSRHKALRANLQEALRRYPIDVTLHEITEVNDLMGYGITGTPALLANDQVVYEDYIPSVGELMDFLKKWDPLVEKFLIRKVILVPVDFSEASAAAFEYAQKLAPVIEADITVLHVTPFKADPVKPFRKDDNSKIPEADKKRLQKFVADYSLEKPGEEGNVVLKILIEKEVAVGLPEEEILKRAVENKVEMIVMGMTGASGLLEKMYGSVSQYVSKNADCPVILVPRKFRFSDFKNILYASNYLNLDEIALKRITEWSKFFNPKLHIVHVENPVSNGYTANSAFFKKIFKHFHPVPDFVFSKLTDENVAEGLNRYIAANPVDLLVMVTRHRSFWQNLLHKSATKRMASVTSVPLMVIHA